MARISNEDVDRAREMDLLTYLQYYDPGNLKHIYGNIYCTVDHDPPKEFVIVYRIYRDYSIVNICMDGITVTADAEEIVSLSLPDGTEITEETIPVEIEEPTPTPTPTPMPEISPETTDIDPEQMAEELAQGDGEIQEG